jgi:hypothetical protein
MRLRLSMMGREILHEAQKHGNLVLTSVGPGNVAALRARYQESKRKRAEQCTAANPCKPEYSKLARFTLSGQDYNLYTHPQGVVVCQLTAAKYRLWYWTGYVLTIGADGNVHAGVSPRPTEAQVGWFFGVGWPTGFEPVDPTGRYWPSWAEMRPQTRKLADKPMVYFEVPLGPVDLRLFCYTWEPGIPIAGETAFVLCRKPW